MFAHAFDQLSQLYPPKPTFTEKNLPDLDGKVYVVTGANTGVGRELAGMLYEKNARVYVAARSEQKATAAMTEIKKAAPDSKGELIFLHLDLADLNTISASAKQFLDREAKLHVLFNNAGVMTPAVGSRTEQGYELQLGVNNIGTFMFTQLLTPTLVSTAKEEGPGNVRVVWVSSSAAEAPMFVPTGGVDLDRIDRRIDEGSWPAYSLSKAGNVLHAQEFAKRHQSDGIVSVSLNPGNLDSELWRTQGPIAVRLVRAIFLHPPKYGAYTELFAGLSPEVTMEKNGAWLGPWGRFLSLRQDLTQAPKSKDEGGYGTSEAFWEWSEAQVKPHL